MIKVGDTVKLRNNSNKHKVDDIYVVTQKIEDSIKWGLQNLLHPLIENKGKFMSKVYAADSKHLVKLHESHLPVNSNNKKSKEGNIKHASNGIQLTNDSSMTMHPRMMNEKLKAL